MIDVDLTPITYTIYGLLLLVFIFGLTLLTKRKMILGIIFWVSVIFNGFLYIYLMGNYRFYPKGLYMLINKYWPILNLVLLIILIISIIKNRGLKKNA